MLSMKAIDTVYRGYRFRSRLEARWAVFFDSLGVKWEYEKEGFDLGGTWYLPDFWLPSQRCWIEIKHEAPTQSEAEKASALAVASDAPVYVFFGTPTAEPENDSAHVWGHLLVSHCEATCPSGCTEHLEAAWDCCQRWCECPSCGLVGIEFEARADRLPCKAVGCPGDGNRQDRGHNGRSPRLLRAYDAARSARFEHGETPA